jgi:hypothetical protein
MNHSVLEIIKKENNNMVKGISTYKSSRKQDVIRECKKRGIATKEEVNAIFEAIKAGIQQHEAFAHNGKIYVLTVENDIRPYTLMYR